MVIEFYPDDSIVNELEDIKGLRDKGRVGRELYKLSRSGDHELFTKVQVFLKRMTEVKDIDIFKKSQQIKPIKEGVWEMRIPPVRTGGVFRIYFCREGDRLILLDAEHKKDKGANNTDNAIRLCKEFKRSGYHGKH